MIDQTHVISQSFYSGMSKDISQEKKITPGQNKISSEERWSNELVTASETWLTHKGAG